MAPTQALTTQQIDFFNEHGYVMAENIIDLETIEALRQEFDEVVRDRIAAMKAEGLVTESYDDQDFDHQLASMARDDLAKAGEVIRRVQQGGEGGHIGPAIFNLMRHPVLLDSIAGIVGPEIVGSSVYRIRPKAPGLDRGAVPWHQDSGYLLPHCDRATVITCWIPLVDATEENGCLYVIPDLFKKGILPHYTGGWANYLEILERDFPAGAEPLCVPVPKGGVLFLHNLTPHASKLNTSDHMRWSVDLRYQGPEVPNNVDKMPEEIDYSGPEIEIACYPPEADFVLRSEAHPERVVSDWRILKQRRLDYMQRYAGHRHSLGGRWKPMPTNQ